MKPIEVKVKSIGRVHVMPRKVYWIGMPDSFKDKERMELLQKDIWVINYPIENIDQLESESEFILFINLDLTIFAGRGVLSIQEIPSSIKLIKNIGKIKPMHTIVHTTHINPQLKEIFTKASYTYIEKNLLDTNAAITTVIKTVNFIYEKTNRTNRAFLRIELDDEDKIPVKCTGVIDKRNQVIDGHISNMSLSGLQIKLKDKGKLNMLPLKDFIELSFVLGHYQIKIQKALIVRIDMENHSIGVYFDIHNEKMVKGIFSTHYTEILYQMTKELLKT